MATDGVALQPPRRSRAHNASTAEETASNQVAVRSIDVFLTYRCGFRCKHCFVGHRLDDRADLPFRLFERLVDQARLWGTEEMVFLGGEPTLYPHLGEALELARVGGYRTRLVTNGHRSFARFLMQHGDRPLPIVCFSIDGSSAVRHDSIRHAGSFSVLLENIDVTRERGATTAGILSVSRENMDDVVPTLRLCDRLGLESVNVHHVTNRGFARSSTVPSVKEWRAVCEAIDAASRTLTFEVRLERTFDVVDDTPFRCAIRSRSNLMFLPDSRVHMCMMFIDVPNSHSFTWTEEGLVPNRHANCEQRIAGNSPGSSCPAMGLVNQRLTEDALANGVVVKCIYDKDRLRSASRPARAMLTH